MYLENYLQGYIQGNRMFRVTELIDPHGSPIAVDVGYGTFCSLPIYENGTYTITFDDIFGNEYQQEVEITALPEDPKISFEILFETEAGREITLCLSVPGFPFSCPCRASRFQQEPFLHGLRKP